ncbi:MAG: glycosyltransferase family 2 protein [Candidatus Tectomicrobia bacterium]|nr:glycosyltransferase family 2 protein [Candidatus Tectomicrobia bacterium]
MSERLLSIVVVNHNGGEMLARCLASIAEQTYPLFDVIVVDNGSTDGSADLDYFEGTNWHLIKLSENTGFASANNRAFSENRSDYIALVNNDVVLSSNWASLMVAALEAHESAGSAASRVLQLKDPRRIDSAGFAYFASGTATSWSGTPADHFSAIDHAPFGAVASAAVYRRSAIDACGPFQNRYFCYYEDTDLAVRLVLHGYDVVYVDAAVARHETSSTGKARSDFHVYHLRRNVEYLFWVNSIGFLVWLFLLPHFVYESLCFVEGLFNRQGGVVLKAKWAALKDFRWILSERRKLGALLRSRGILNDGRRRLRSRQNGAWRGVFRPENFRKIRG